MLSHVGRCTLCVCFCFLNTYVTMWLIEEKEPRPRISYYKECQHVILWKVSGTGAFVFFCRIFCEMRGWGRKMRKIRKSQNSWCFTLFSCRKQENWPWLFTVDIVYQESTAIKIRCKSNSALQMWTVVAWCYKDKVKCYL